MKKKTTKKRSRRAWPSWGCSRGWRRRRRSVECSAAWARQSVSQSVEEGGGRARYLSRAFLCAFHQDVEGIHGGGSSDTRARASQHTTTMTTTTRATTRAKCWRESFRGAATSSHPFDFVSGASFVLPLERVASWRLRRWCYAERARGVMRASSRFVVGEEKQLNECTNEGRI